MDIIVIFSILPAVLCTDFKSVPTTVKTYENDTVLLPCYLDSTGTEETGGEPESIRWYKNAVLIANSDPTASDKFSDRIKLWVNGSLQVANVRNTDTGEYMCEVVRKEPWTSIKQLHAIEVQESPTVEANPSSGFLQVKLGEEVNMSCSASGVPYPLMTWKSKGTEMKLLDNRQTLKFPATDRHLSGIYECVASNGVGTPAKAKIELSIIYPPEVTSGKSWIHTSPGLRATLGCMVSADPAAEVKWYKSKIAVPFDARVVSLVDGDKHILIIRNVRISDFGIYTCRAANELGTVEIDIQLSGVANPCIFKEMELK
ncbi:wrapper [Carabus blaptoides fortunei]